ncbi:MAG: electron transfer flavoprotein beta subunit/FixA family protein [Anaerolineales bacterium]|nr:electron transfer flavoprotein beta subunit/FixA family protein [Anaerolineales bacterium]
MHDLHMIVCMKVVPKPEEIHVDRKTLRILREGTRSEFNPPDMNALEMALNLKDVYGGRISILSMGPLMFEPFLRIGLAMGADEAFLLSDKEFAGADTLATTYTLAEGIKKIGTFELVFCGEESSDGATGQVPPGLAEWLDLPQITLAGSIAVDREKNIVRGKRESSGGYQILETHMPAVISVKTASNEPRFMDYDIKDWALNTAPLTIWDRADLEADEAYIGVSGSPTIVSGLEQASTQERRVEFLSGNQEEIVQQLVQIIREST